MVAFVDEHREGQRVESIYDELPIAPSTYYADKAAKADTKKISPCRKRDDFLRAENRRIWEEIFKV